MAKMYNTAMGKKLDVDGLLMKNEHIIAVGNMKVNARGDQLGPGGKVVKTRDQVMKEYYALNTPVAVDSMENMAPAAPKAAPKPTTMVADAEPVAPIMINPESGLDEDDEGPAVVAIADKPVEEVLIAPVEAPVVLAPEPTLAPVQAVTPPPMSRLSSIEPDDLEEPTEAVGVASSVKAALPTPIMPQTLKPIPFIPKDIRKGVPAGRVIPPPAPSLGEVTERPNVSQLPPLEPATAIRGALANAVHNSSTVTQREMLPPKKADGIRRF